MSGKEYQIRHMTEQEVVLAVEWAAGEGWNPGLHDASCFWSADPKGFLVGILDGEPIGCISAVRYPGDFGFIGFYIVKAQWRGQGYGLRLWERAMAQLAGCRVGLDGVVAQQENYRKSGFEFAYSNIRYSMQGSADMPAANLAGRGLIVPVKELDIQALAEYDQRIFRAERGAFLSQWLTQADGTAFAAVSDGKIAGYGAIRQCRDGYKIGPLFADDEIVAEGLFQMLAAQGKGEKIFLDVPEVNQGAMNITKRYHMEKVFETARMYRGSAPEIPVDQVFGVTSFELG